MSKGIFGGMFDFNKDGKMSIGERAVEFAFIQHLMDVEEESKSTIECEGFDYNKLSTMDEFERNEVLESEGLDLDDYDFD